MITDLDRNLDELEQYGRKSCLVLGGAFPDESEGETPAQTRETTLKVIKEKLKVDIKGSIAACHRLGNRKRVIVKFNDLDDREAVYQAKFTQGGEWSEKVTIHESLTKRRANMLLVLEQMRKDNDITHYHTKNGQLMVRDSPNKRYTRIQPWYTEADIKDAVAKASAKSYNSKPNRDLLRSQTLRNIPSGNVAHRTADLEEHVVGKIREARRTRRGRPESSSEV